MYIYFVDWARALGPRHLPGESKGELVWTWRAWREEKRPAGNKKPIEILLDEIETFSLVCISGYVNTGL